MSIINHRRGPCYTRSIFKRVVRIGFGSSALTIAKHKLAFRLSCIVRGRELKGDGIFIVVGNDEITIPLRIDNNGFSTRRG